MGSANATVHVVAWLGPALAALFLYGLGQGLVKKWIGEVHPARFCLYYVFAISIVNIGFFLTHEHPALFTSAALSFLAFGVFAYLFDGAAWILYYQSIVEGPVAIVGTLSAAYPALTVVFARIFLHEELSGAQYIAVALVIVSCIGLAWAPSGPGAATQSKRWIPLSLIALVFWGIQGTMIKHAYSLPEQSEVSLAMCSVIGDSLTLGVYGLLRGRRGEHTLRGWLHSFVPMGMMAGGSLAVIIAASLGPISMVTPITGAYPIVTVIYSAFVLREKVTPLQYACIGAIVVGILLCST